MILAAAIALSATVVVAVSGIALPVLVDLVSKSHASRRVKETVLAVLSIIAGLVSSAVATDGTAVVTTEAAVNAVIAYGLAWVAFRKIPPVKAAADRVQAATPTFGIG